MLTDEPGLSLDTYRIAGIYYVIMLLCYCFLIIILVTYQPGEEALEISKAIHEPTHKDASRTTLDKSKPARLPACPNLLFLCLPGFPTPLQGQRVLYANIGMTHVRMGLQ